MEHYGFELDAALRASGAVKPAVDTHRPVVIVDDSVDDQMQLMRELEHILGPVPYIVFPSGTELVHYLDSHTRDSEKPRLIFLDLIMGGLDGLATLELLQDRLGLRGVPIVAVSCTRNAMTVKNALEAGAQAFLPKPVARWDMIKVLHGKACQGVLKVVNADGV